MTSSNINMLAVLSNGGRYSLNNINSSNVLEPFMVGWGAVLV